jgi:nucleotidyltransferase/DNA polymerase involved in DNA repair
MSEIIKKIAIQDSSTGEFYIGGEWLAKSPEFSLEISKSKLYLDRSELYDIYDYLCDQTHRPLQLLEVSVSYSVVGVSDYLERRDSKIKKEFEKLNQLAEKDIDAMTEKQYQRWRKLRSQLRAAGEIET